MRNFNVCVLNHGIGKSAIITENNEVVVVLNCEGLSNTEMLRYYSKTIKEIVGNNEARIVTNHERVKRKTHTSDFPDIIYNFSRFKYPQWFYNAACEWTDEQDRKLQKVGE